MANESVIKLFEGKQVRIVWDEEQEKYYFSVVDVVLPIPQAESEKTSVNANTSDKILFILKISLIIKKCVQMKLHT